MALTLVMVSCRIDAGILSLEHRLELNLWPETQRLEARDEVHIRGSGHIRFGLAAGLQLQRATLDGRPVEIVLHQGVGELKLGAEGSHRLLLEYGGRLPDAPAEARRYTAGSERPLLSADYGYFPPGSGWYPEFGHHPFAYRLDVTLPVTQQAVAPGRLAAPVAEPGGRHRQVIESDHPAYEITLLTGPYRMREQARDGRRVRTYFFDGMESLSDEYLAFGHRYLQRFEERIGSYPYPYFHIVAARLPLGLGFAGIAYMGDRVLRLPFIKHSSLGHEVLHNWWGNGVRVDYEQGNWAEGLTTYMADYAFLAQRSQQAGREQRLAWLRDYAALPAERDRPVRSFTGKDHAASQVIGYNKVAFIFHMLGQEIGENVFNGAVRRFWHEKRFKVAGWREIEQVFSDTAGVPLSAFFDQWLERPGAAELSVTAVAKSPRGDGGWRLSFEVNQPQPGYRLTVDLVVPMTQGVHRQRILLESSRTRIRLNLPREPQALMLDPDFHLFRHLAPGEAPPILRDAWLSDGLQLLALGDEGFAGQALELARGFSDTPVRRVARVAVGQAPFILIGPPAQVDAYLEAQALPGLPTAFAEPSDAQVWAGRTADGQPYMVVRVADRDALVALRRPLPHYGSRSYLAFEGDRAILKGTWPPENSGIRARL